MERGWQVIIRLADDRVIAPTTAQRRVFADVAQRLGRPRRLFAFDAPDTHAHFAVAADHEQARRLAHDLRLALPPALDHPVAFLPPKIVAIRDQWHLDRLFAYVLGQQERHGVQGDPLRESSNLPDLLGLRVSALWTAALVRELLPRVDRARLLQVMGVPDFGEGWQAALLPEATAAAAGLPDLERRTDRHVAARAAACRVARDAGQSTSEIAARLGLAARGVRALLARPADPVLDRAIRLQMGLRLLLGRDEALFLREPVVQWPAADPDDWGVD